MSEKNESLESIAYTLFLICVFLFIVSILFFVEGEKYRKVWENASTNEEKAFICSKFNCYPDAYWCDAAEGGIWSQRDGKQQCDTWDACWENCKSNVDTPPPFPVDPDASTAFFVIALILLIFSAAWAFYLSPLGQYLKHKIGSKENKEALDKFLQKNSNTINSLFTTSSPAPAPAQTINNGGVPLAQVVGDATTVNQAQTSPLLAQVAKSAQQQISSASSSAATVNQAQTPPILAQVAKSAEQQISSASSSAATSSSTTADSTTNSSSSTSSSK